MTIVQSASGKTMLNKVPEVTLYFWIIKIMATTVGETAADFLNINLGFGLNVTSWVMSGLTRRRARVSACAGSLCSLDLLAYRRSG